LRILMIGDSQMHSIAAGFLRLTGQNSSIRVKEISVHSSGFIRSDYYNWPKKLKNVFEESQNEPYDIAVIFLGMNDYQNFYADNGKVLVKVSGDSDNLFRITSQPIDMSASPGKLVMLGVAVTGGTQPYRYQWSYSENGRTNFFPSKAVGNKTNILKVPTERKTYYYQCEIKDDTGKALYSDIVKVTETSGAPFEIVRQPVGGYANYGEYFDLEVKGRGGREPYTYQWQYYDRNGFRNCTGPGNNEKMVKVIVDNSGIYKFPHRCVIKDADNKELITNPVVITLNE